MTTEAREVGHVLLDDHGQMLGLDAGFCEMMRSDAAAMVGRGVLDFTAPDDRETCRAGMVRLRQTGAPFTMRKRMQRGDGSIVWVEQVTTQVEFPDAAPMIVASFRQIAAPTALVDPGALLDQAHFLHDSRAMREDMFGSVLFANPSWDLLLKAYIAEAEGRTVDVAAMARTARISVAVAFRWARALASEGLLEIETGGAEGAAPVYRLTSEAHARLEAYLSQRLHRLADLGVIA